jgi:hypothetical protein
MLLIMLACGWRPDVDREKREWKRASPIIVGRLIIPIFCLLGAFALCSIAGINDKHGRLVIICLLVPFLGAAWFWSYKKRSRVIKKLNRELTCKRNDKPKE